MPCSPRVRRTASSASTRTVAPSVVTTAGNADSHIVLRGGREGGNYGARHTADTERRLREAGLHAGFMVDCSHANSAKNPRRQAVVWRNVLAQRHRGRASIIGAMLESYLEEGNQAMSADRRKLRLRGLGDRRLHWLARDGKSSCALRRKRAASPGQHPAGGGAMTLLETPVGEASWAALDFESAGAALAGATNRCRWVWPSGVLAEMSDFFRSYHPFPGVHHGPGPGRARHRGR